MLRSKLFMVIDVESVGLHGEGFAVGFVVVRLDGTEVACGRFACDPAEAQGEDQGREWIAEHLPPFALNCHGPREVRDSFWAQWEFWKHDGAVLVADCAWPVEARFLAACVDDAPASRGWIGPYPLYELASLLLVVGADPTQAFGRGPGEEPKHDPLADARQSGRLWVDTLRFLGEADARERVARRQSQ